MQLEPSPEHDEYIIIQQKRLKLRQSMQSAIKGYAFIDDVLSTKTSKVNLINKFTSKLKTENRNIQQLITEMQTLNISKFLDQVAIIIASTATTNQVKQLAQLACRIGTFYQTFPITIIKELKKQIDNVLSQQNRSQLLALFHLIIELFVYGFPLLQTDIPDLIKKVFKAGVNTKQSNQTDQNKKQKSYAFNIDFYWILAKQFGEVFCGLTSRRSQLWTKQGRKIIKFPEMTTVQIKKSIYTFLQKYIKQVSGILEQSVKNIQKIQNSLRQQLKLNGKFSEQTQKLYNDFVERFLKTKSKLIDLGEYTSTEIIFTGMNQKIINIEQISKQQYSIAENGEIFEDDYQKQLYLNLSVLSDQNPKQQNEKTYQDFKSKLDTCKTIQDADSVIQLFLPINNKKNRRILVKDLLQYRKQYQLMTPFLCRIAATLNKKWKDIQETINEMIFSQYDKLSKDSTATNFITTDKKTRNHKYICQLTKFKLVDPLKTISCMKSLIDDLIGSNIDLLLVCLQSVGRYLYLTKQSTSKFIFLLTQLKNVMKKKPLPIMIESQINNCIALLKPIEPIIKKQKTPKTQTQLKLKQLLHNVNKDNVDSTINQIRKLTEGNQQAQNLFIKRLIRAVPKHQFIQNYFLAVILYELQNKNLNIKIKQIIKQKILQLIQDEESQLCLAWARFYGELFNYQLIEREDFYSFIRHLLRIQQNTERIINCICTMINSSLQCFEVKKTASINQKLRLLLDFKVYINTRNYIPMFIEFEILDLFEKTQPTIISMTNEQISKFRTLMQQKQQGRQKQLNQLKQLQNFVISKKKPLYKQKVQEEQQHREKQQTRFQSTQIQSKNQHELDDEFNNYMKQEIQKSMGRMAKPKLAETVPVKKKKTNQKSIIILGKSGDKVVRKQINLQIKMNDSTQQQYSYYRFQF